MYGIYIGLNPSNHFSCRTGLIEALVLIEEPQLSNYLIRILIQFSTRKALGRLLRQEYCNSTEDRTTKEGVVFFVGRGGKRRDRADLICFHTVRWICTLRPASRSCAQNEISEHEVK